MTKPNSEIKLNVPVTVDGTKTDKITLRRVTVADLEAIQSETGSFMRTKRLFHLSSGLPMDVISKMDAADYNRATEELADFL